MDVVLYVIVSLIVLFLASLVIGFFLFGIIMWLLAITGHIF